MRLIDADALKKAIIKHLCVKSENNLFPAEKSIYNCIDEQPTIELLKEQQPKWIPVTERLPEADYDFKTVLGYMPHDDQVRPVVYCRKTKDFKCHGVIGREYPTHWMPLPEKPKT